VLGEEDISEDEQIVQVKEEPDIPASQRFDLRKQDELLSNPSSVIENELIQRA
jgi:hypothetical protein